MEPFSDFLEVLKQIDDRRRAEGKLYDVAHVVLFTIIAMLSGANSYRQTIRPRQGQPDRAGEGDEPCWALAPVFS